jgi:uncharacterized protein YpmS
MFSYFHCNSKTIEEKGSQMKNGWKFGFFGLLGIDLVIVIFIAAMLLTPASESVTPNIKEPAEGFIPLYVQTNKEDLNKLINSYLKKEAENSPVDYQVKLGNEVELYGKIPFFNEELNMMLSFEPKALANGDLILKQKNISVGNLRLPVTNVLKIIEDNYQLPQGVDIQPNQKLVYIDMERLKFKNKTKVKAETFDLKQNRIVFSILVPVK